MKDNTKKRVLAWMKDQNIGESHIIELVNVAILLKTDPDGLTVMIQDFFFTDTSYEDVEELLSIIGD